MPMNGSVISRAIVYCAVVSERIVQKYCAFHIRLCDPIFALKYDINQRNGTADSHA